VRSSFFYEDQYKEVAEKIEKHINSVPDFLSQQTAGSTRAAGDAIENIIADKFDTFLGDWCAEYSSTFARRAMADLAYKDAEGFYCVVDVKTHREDTNFNMPNLTSVERLSRFYEEDTNIFALILVKYSVHENQVRATDVTFAPIEFLDWSCLTIGALGWGQIQIANSNHLQVNDKYSRRDWMLTLCDNMLSFYPREIAKIHERLDRFRSVKTLWESREDVWA